MAPYVFATTFLTLIWMAGVAMTLGVRDGLDYKCFDSTDPAPRIIATLKEYLRIIEHGERDRALYSIWECTVALLWPIGAVYYLMWIPCWPFAQVMRFGYVVTKRTGQEVYTTGAKLLTRKPPTGGELSLVE